MEFPVFDRCITGNIFNQILNRVQETGEVEKDLVVKLLRSDIRNSIKDNFIISYLMQWPATVSMKIKQVGSLQEKKDSTPGEHTNDKRA